MKFVEIDGLQFEVLPLPQRILQSVIDPIRNWAIPQSTLRALVKRSPSPLIQETILRPGGWRSMNIVYGNADPVDWLDQMAVRYNPISIGSRNRRKLVTAKLVQTLKSLSGESRLELMGIGAGPGLHLQDAVIQANIDPDAVKIWLIDLDSDSFEFGRQYAAAQGLDRTVEYVQGDAREIKKTLPDVSPHVVKIVGLLEYLTDEQAVQLFRTTRELIRPNGRLLTHGLVDRYRSGHFLNKAFGLKHIQRTADDVRNLLQTARFEVVEISETPLRIYPVVVAKPC